MPGNKITQLPSLSSASDDDVLPIVDSPAASPSTKQITKGNLLSGYFKAGGTDVPVTDGGTGSSTAAGARSNLGAASASHTHPDTDLSSLATLNARYGYKTVRTVGPNTVNADYLTDDSGDNSEVDQAITAVYNRGGGIVVLLGRATGKYEFAAPAQGRDSVLVIGEGKIASQVRGSFTSGSHAGLFNVSGKQNVGFGWLGFEANGGATAITSYGHDWLSILDCYFTGTTNAFGGIINLDGQFGSTPMSNTTIERCLFKNIPNARIIHLYPRNTNTLEETHIIRNRFENTFGHQIDLDAYTTLRGTYIERNLFKNIKSAPGLDANTAGVAIYGGIAVADQVFDTFIDGNRYFNTNLTSNGEQYGFTWIYAAHNTNITRNTGIGSWTASEDTVGPWLAPGRLETPDVGLIVSDNYIEGFNAAWDPDSMRHVDVHDNEVINCGAPFSIGYGTQDYVNIHDNDHYNSPNSVYGAAALFANSTPKKSFYVRNIFVDDRIAPVMVKAILLTGHHDFSDVVVEDNKVYVPHGTLNPSSIFAKEFGDEKEPKQVSGNEIHDSTGAKVDPYILSKTSAYTLNNTDGVLLADASAGGFTVTAPAVANVAIGKTFTVKRVSASGDVTVATTSGQTIDGATTKVLGSQFAGITFESTGAGWTIIHQMGTVT